METAEKQSGPVTVIDRPVQIQKLRPQEKRVPHPLNFAKDTIFFTGPRDGRYTTVWGSAPEGGSFQILDRSNDGMSFFGIAKMKDGTTERVWLHKKGKRKEESGWRTQPQTPEGAQYELKA